MLTSLQVLVVLILFLDKGCMEDKYSTITADSCTCPGDELAFECTVDGDGGTYWRGTALQECLQSRILIRHSRFNGNGHIERKSCGASGTVIVSTISVVNNSFTTRLTITVNQQLNGSTIECTSDSGRRIGSSKILLKTAPNVSSINFTLGNMEQEKLMFTWMGASESCPGVDYEIISKNCGDCPHSINSSFVTCTNFSKPRVAAICTLTVQAVVCDSILGRASEPIAVFFVNSPSPPRITHAQALYNGSIRISFNTADSHNQCQTSQIESHVISYTIKYFDPQTNTSCGTDTIAASSCADQTCNHIFDLNALCSNSTYVSVTVLATNMQGDGKQSEPITAVVQYMEFESGGSNYVPQILGYSTSNLIIITACSILGGIVLLLFLAILPLSILTCQRYKSRRFEFQNVRVSFDEPISPNRINSGELNESAADVGIVQKGDDIHENDSKEGNEVLELVTMDTNNNNTDHDAVNKSVECECRTAELETVIYENNFHEIDKLLNLDNLLIQIRPQVTQKWYQFGLAVGISKETLDEFSNFPPEECIVEMLDLWLRTSETAITWRDVADALKEIGLYQLAEKTLKIYKTGKLSAGLGSQCFPQLNLVHPYDSMEQLPSLSMKKDNTEVAPPLPPKTYQCTSELL